LTSSANLDRKFSDHFVHPNYLFDLALPLAHVVIAATAAETVATMAAKTMKIIILSTLCSPHFYLCSPLPITICIMLACYSEQ